MSERCRLVLPFAAVLMAPLALACTSTATSSTSGAVSSDASSDAGLPAAPTTTGCDGAKLLPVPADPALPGPWPVGARTVQLPGLTTATTLTAEVWYPAAPGSEKTAKPVAYDLREHLSKDDAGKLKDADNPLQIGNCFRDLPLDTAHGPYPMVLFMHGTAGFRTQSLRLMTHWASRGFVVVAADHPGLELKAVLALDFNFDQAKEAAVLLQALHDQPPAFLQGHVQTERLGAAGHSAGGMSTAGLGAQSGVRVLLPMAAAGSQGGPQLGLTLVLGGVADQVVSFANTRKGYDQTPGAKRLIGLGKAGHLAFSDLCLIGADRGGILQIAIDAGIEVNPMIAKLANDGCGKDNLSPVRGIEIIGAASSAALESELQCNGAMAKRLADLAKVYPEVAEVQAAP
jgi:hypothetical protein